MERRLLEGTVSLSLFFFFSPTHGCLCGDLSEPDLPGGEEKVGTSETSDGNQASCHVIRTSLVVGARRRYCAAFLCTFSKISHSAPPSRSPLSKVSRCVRDDHHSQSRSLLP
mmetsp:Transcript_43231/g.64087  ORF Transcript_43231/g.64087 Transcript_43231/m.64087 type:complete len:112 (+) Transcript_43231:186-521(+)